MARCPPIESRPLSLCQPIGLCLIYQKTLEERDKKWFVPYIQHRDVVLLKHPDLVVTVHPKRSMSKQASVGRVAEKAIPVDGETNLHDGGGGRGEWTD
jgi:hypothetical protein